jgi:hypothetical protein
MTSTKDIGSVMPCGAVVTNVYEAYEAGKKTAANATIRPTTMQPVVNINGVKRFKANDIICYIFDTHPLLDMNALSRMDFSDEDRMQFAQLIGYSISGYGDLSYVSDASYEAAEKSAHNIEGENK